jgi:hypothetical protein
MAALWEGYNLGLSRWIAAETRRVPEMERAAPPPPPRGNLMGSTFGQAQTRPAAAPAPTSMREVCQQANVPGMSSGYCACAGSALERQLSVPQQDFLRRNPPLTWKTAIDVIPRLEASLRPCTLAPPIATPSPSLIGTSGRAGQCTLEDLAGDYESSFQVLSCRADQQELHCCYGQGCTNAMRLRPNDTHTALKGRYWVQAGRQGDVEFPVDDQCRIGSGRFNWTVSLGHFGQDVQWTPFQVMRRLQPR